DGDGQELATGLHRLLPRELWALGTDGANVGQPPGVVNRTDRAAPRRLAPAAGARHRAARTRWPARATARNEGGGEAGERRRQRGGHRAARGPPSAASVVGRLGRRRPGEEAKRWPSWATRRRFASPTRAHRNSRARRIARATDHRAPEIRPHSP